MKPKLKQKKLIEKINKLKLKKDACILVHNYQRPELYEIADFIGDSLDLSKYAQKTNKKIIVFCGVKFMAETAKILSPQKKVLLPASDADCPMANMINAKQLKEFKKLHPDAAVVAYVNTNADVKAHVHACCTSKNAVEVVNSLKQNKILFVPDRNLASYVQTKTKKKIIPWQGFCYVHERITEDEAKQSKKNHPDAIFIAHPECPKSVLKHADYILSTGGMVKFAKENNNKKIILGTEINMVERLKKINPKNQYFTIGKTCVNMKKTTLEKVFDALRYEQFEITVPKEIETKSKKALDRMVEQK